MQRIKGFLILACEGKTEGDVINESGRVQLPLVETEQGGAENPETKTADRTSDGVGREVAA